MIGVQEGSPKVCSVHYSTWDVSVSHEGSGEMKLVSKVCLAGAAATRSFTKVFSENV